MSTDAPACQLYLVTPPRLDAAAFASLLAAALDAGPIAAVQLRLKDVDDDTVRAACNRLRPIVQDRDIAFILNDRPDLAAALGCDGVHVGQSDASYRDARAAMGAEGIVGVTCHASRHLAIEAADAGADYVAFGAVYPTTTKEAKHRADPDLLAWWSAMMTVPCVAIGGITVANAAPVVAAGADFLAVCAGVWAHPDGPAAAVRAFDRLLQETVTA